MIRLRLHKCGVMRILLAIPAVILIWTFAGDFLQQHTAAGAQKEKSIWDGVFTREQAARGENVSHEYCVECHSEDLTGGEGSALVGAGFMLNWEGQSLDSLFRKIRETMPLEAVNDVSEKQKLEVLAYILQENNFPSGTAELTGDAELLSAISILPKGGLSAPGTGSPVQVIGCLAEGPQSDWTLLHATAPIRTALDAPTPTDPAAIEAIALGDQTIRLLQVFPSPASHKGHKMQARGFLVKRPDGDAISIVSLDMLASACGE